MKLLAKDLGREHLGMVHVSNSDNTLSVIRKYQRGDGVMDLHFYSEEIITVPNEEEITLEKPRAVLAGEARELLRDIREKLFEHFKELHSLKDGTHARWTRSGKRDVWVEFSNDKKRVAAVLVTGQDFEQIVGGE